MSAFGLIGHFIADLFHFDGKFFKSMGRLFFKPGLLPKEYTEGKRKKNLDPIRMYIFTSAFFFFIFFLFLNTSDSIKFNGNEALTMAQRDSVIKKLNEKIKEDPESVALLNNLELLNDSTQEINPLKLSTLKKDFTLVSIGEEKYKSKAEYDSIQKSLPKAERNGWLVRNLYHKQFEINEKYKANGEEALKSLFEVFLHKLPILLFVSLPLFALVLKLLYIRRRKFYYVDHAVFSLYQYVFSFILILLILLFSKLKDLTNYGIINFIQFILIVYWIYYLYKAMNIFYEQSKWKTIIKIMFLFFFGLVINLSLFIVFFFFSIFQL